MRLESVSGCSRAATANPEAVYLCVYLRKTRGPPNFQSHSLQMYRNTRYRTRTRHGRPFPRNGTRKRSVIWLLPALYPGKHIRKHDHATRNSSQDYRLLVRHSHSFQLQDVLELDAGITRRARKQERAAVGLWKHDRDGESDWCRFFLNILQYHNNNCNTNIVKTLLARTRSKFCNRRVS